MKRNLVQKIGDLRKEGGLRGAYLQGIQLAMRMGINSAVKLPERPATMYNPLQVIPETQFKARQGRLDNGLPSDRTPLIGHIMSMDIPLTDERKLEIRTNLVKGLIKSGMIAPKREIRTVPAIPSLLDAAADRAHIEVVQSGFPQMSDTEALSFGRVLGGRPRTIDLSSAKKG